MNQSEIEAMKRRLADRQDEEVSPLALLGGVFWVLMSVVWVFIF